VEETMSDSKSRSSLAVAVAVTTVIGLAGVVGYVAGRSSDAAPAAPRVGSAGAAESRIAETPAARPAVLEENPVAANRPTSAVAAPATRRAVGGPIAGERQRLPVAIDRAAPVSSEGPRAAAEAEVAEEPVAAPDTIPASVDSRPRPVEVPAGTRIELVLESPVSSQTAVVGERVEATLAAPIRSAGEIVVPSGARVIGRVTEVKALAKIGGQARLALAFESLETEAGTVPLAAFWAREGKSETGKDAATIAAGAAIGTVLGNQAKKNDRGKLIGAVLGAGVGTAAAAATKGEIVELGAGSMLELTLREAVTVQPLR
jgi:hypothetical protein